MCGDLEWEIFGRPRREILNKKWFVGIIIAVWLVTGYMNPFRMGTQMHFGISQPRTRNFSFVSSNVY